MESFDSSISIEVVAANAAMGSSPPDELIHRWKEIEEHYLELLDKVESLDKVDSDEFTTIENYQLSIRKKIAAQVTLAKLIEAPAEATNSFSSTRYKRLLNWYNKALSHVAADSYEEAEALGHRVENIFSLGSNFDWETNIMQLRCYIPG